MRIPRFRIRTMMVAVAIAGLAFGTDRLARRRAYYDQRAEIWQERADDFVTGTGVCLREELDRPGMYMKLYEHNLALAKKYREVARRPWLPVEPDPPQPE